MTKGNFQRFPVEMMLSMVAGMVGKRLTYMELIGM